MVKCPAYHGKKSSLYHGSPSEYSMYMEKHGLFTSLYHGKSSRLHHGKMSRLFKISMFTIQLGWKEAGKFVRILHAHFYHGNSR